MSHQHPTRPPAFIHCLTVRDSGQLSPLTKNRYVRTFDHAHKNTCGTNKTFSFFRYFSILVLEPTYTIKRILPIRSQNSSTFLTITNMLGSVSEGNMSNFFTLCVSIFVYSLYIFVVYLICTWREKAIKIWPLLS